VLQRDARPAGPGFSLRESKGNDNSFSPVVSTASATSARSIRESLQTLSVSEAHVSYTVRSGDTLSGIAARQGLSLSTLERDNPKLRNANKLAVGQRLNLHTADTFEPAKKAPPTSISTAARSSASPSAAVGLAQQHLGQLESTLQRTGVTQRGVSLSHSCANFVSSMLQKSGAIDFHSNAVSDLSKKLQSDGWHPVSRANAKPGDVWISNGAHGESHTELVASNVNGNVTLIGSNNHPVRGNQQVNYDSYSARMSGTYILAPA
jgi:LysM repeat protein